MKQETKANLENRHASPVGEQRFRIVRTLERVVPAGQRFQVLRLEDRIAPSATTLYTSACHGHSGGGHSGH